MQSELQQAVPLITGLSPAVVLETFALVMARVGPLVLLSPIFSRRLVPLAVRIAALILLACPIAVSQLGSANGTALTGEGMMHTGSGAFILLLLREAVIGGVFALGISVVFAALSAAGSLMDTQRGEGATGHVGTKANAGAPLGTVYWLSALTVLMATGGSGMIVQSLVRSYAVVSLRDAPITQWANAQVPAILFSLADLFGLSLAIAAPVLLAVFIIDIAFVVLSRVSPGIQAWALALSIKPLLVIVLALMSLSMAMQVSVARFV